MTRLHTLQTALLALLLLVTPGYWSQAAAPGTQPSVNAALGEARAHWLTKTLIAWDAPMPGPVVLNWSGESDGPTRIMGSRLLEPAGTVSGRLAAAVPHLKGTKLYRLISATRSEVSTALKGRVSVAVRAPDGSLSATTGLQIGGVLDDLYANDEPLGCELR